MIHTLIGLTALALPVTPWLAAWLIDVAAGRDQTAHLARIDRPEGARRRAEQAWGMDERRRPR